jgi:hypothetical protein
MVQRLFPSFSISCLPNNKLTNVGLIPFNICQHSYGNYRKMFVRSLTNTQVIGLYQGHLTKGEGSVRLTSLHLWPRKLVPLTSLDLDQLLLIIQTIFIFLQNKLL